MTELIALLDGLPIGRLATDKNGRPHFHYEPEYRERADAIPLSLSLPLGRKTHDAEIVAAVLWGLLPDNEHTLQRWANKFHVSARNPLALLANVGEDCAGAVQFAAPARVAELTSDGDAIEWFEESELADRLRSLRRDSAAVRRPQDLGQFSLAGAQPKTALLFQDGRWGVPHGRVPTTHILKPPTGHFDGYVENEHFCLNLARRMGLPTCASSVLRAEDELAICVERYDRVLDGDHWQRVHQEDFCQALGVMPQTKYQNQGGPSPADIANLLRRQSNLPTDDIAIFFLALVFNWLIGGTDAHAKNYSVLFSPGLNVRLAPFYDLSSALPYPSLQRQKIKMAMKYGSHYRWADIRTSDWTSLAQGLHIDGELALIAVRAMAAQLPDEAAATVAEMRAGGIDHAILDKLVDGIAKAAALCIARVEA